MKKIYAFIFFIHLTQLSASEHLPKPEGTETIPVSKTAFMLIEEKGERIVDLTGKNFIIVSVREQGSDGRFYAVDKDGTIWWSGPITSGVGEFRSPSGIFPVLQKKRYHMSREHPDEDGINNMNYMIRFTPKGHALHEGSVDWMSYGCIHIDSKDIPVLYKWTNHKTKIVITRHKYMPYAREDLRKIYLP